MTNRHAKRARAAANALVRSAPEVDEPVKPLKPPAPKTIGRDPASMGIVVRVVLITPEWAAWMLDHRPTNRALKWRSVEKLVRAILEGSFVLNGETIVFEGLSHDSLIDGQNRLEAIVRARKAVETMVVYNVGAVMSTIDTGVSRGLTDLLAMRGEGYAAQLGSAASYLWRHLNGIDATIDAPSSTEVEKVLLDHPHLRDAVQHVIPWTKSDVRIPHGLLAFAWYAFDLIDRDQADSFFEGLATGANLGPRDPRLVARSVFHKLNRQSKTWKHHQKKHSLAYLVLAWNAYHEGRLVDRITWAPRDRNAFPRIADDKLALEPDHG